MDKRNEFIDKYLQLCQEYGYTVSSKCPACRSTNASFDIDKFDNSRYSFISVLFDDITFDFICNECQYYKQGCECED